MKQYEFNNESKTAINTCRFTNFNLEKKHLAFDVIVNFEGIVPKTNQYIKYNNQTFPFEAEFSEELEYDNLDVFQMIECYIKQAKLFDCFDIINIELEKKGKQHDFENAENYLFWNSYGLDSYSIYLTLKDKLKERMIEFSWTTDKQYSYLEGMINRCQHYRTPVVICFKKMLETVDLLWNPHNSTYLGFLLNKKFNIKLSLYGDVAFSYFQPYNIKNINRLNFGFYQTELISLYISMLLGDRKVFNSMLFDNGDSKIIRKVAYSKILTDYLGIKFEDYIDMDRFNVFKKKIKNKSFDYYFDQESSHPSMLTTNIYFFKEEFIKALIELLYTSEKDIVEERFQKFFEKQKGGYPLYNGNYFTISYNAFKQYMDNLRANLKELEEIMCDKYKSLNLFDTNESPKNLCANNNLMDIYNNSKKYDVIFPAFSHNNIPVVLACDNNYAPYGAITINSIIQNATPENNYDIILLHTDISVNNQNKIYELAKDKSNVSIRILDISEYLEQIQKDLFVHNFYSIATYFRILIPSVCSLYEKVLYLDTDMITCSDVTELYHIDVSGCFLAASPDFAAICQANLGKKMPDRNLTYNEYFKNILGIKNINRYFQAGALVINVDKFKQHNIYQQFMDKIKEVKNPFYVDQDILNSVCYGKVKFFDAVWNHVTHIKNCNYFKGFIPAKYFQQYVKARQNPKLIHFTGPEKPWHNPKWILADYFWKYVTGTPFAEILMFGVVSTYISRYVNSDNWSIDMDTVVYTHLYEQKQIRNKLLVFLQKFTFGKKKQKISDKLKIYNYRLQKAKLLIQKQLNFYKTESEVSYCDLIAGSNLFDCDYYETKYNIKSHKAIKHYCKKGWLKGYNPNEIFNSKEYNKINKCKDNPLIDYIKNGKQLGNYVCIKPIHQASITDIEQYRTVKNKNRRKQVIYTCLTGDYDQLINHKYINHDWSYICFTDNQELLKNKEYGIWDIRPLHKHDLGDILNNRYHKILPYKIFPSEVEKSIYIDANCNILTPYLFETLENSNQPLLIPIHFSTVCLYQEMDWYNRHYPQFHDKSNELRNKFLIDGFPKNYGMNENNIIYRIHSDEKIKKIMNLWWNLLVDYVPRDQLSLSYCLWKYGITPDEIAIPNARIDIKNFVLYPHKKGL